MRDGYIEQTGAPLDLYDSPANIFVAGFIGSPSMNFLDAKVSKGKVILPTGQTLGDAPESAAEGTDIIAGVRPEDLIAGKDGIEATVILVEPTGAEIQLTLDLAGKHVVLTTRNRVEERRGSKVHLDIAPGKLHCFDSKTEQVLR